MLSSLLPSPLPLINQASTEPEGSSGQAGTGGAMNISLDQFNFDPHLGVSDSGEETEI